MNDQGEEIQQRTRGQPNCPNYCEKFNCIMYENCGMQCKKLDMAQALICELCENPCSTEKQKILMLDMTYYDQKKKEFTKKFSDGFAKVRDRHKYLELRYKELRKEKQKVSGLNFMKKIDIVKQGSLVRNNLEQIREFMDMIELPYEKEVEIKDGNK